MAEKYPNLYSLLVNEPQAERYFASLPKYVRTSIESRSNNINSFESLRDYAENLLRGDD